MNQTWATEKSDYALGNKESNSSKEKNIEEYP
jgi:hypothetical protein